MTREGERNRLYAREFGACCPKGTDPLEINPLGFAYRFGMTSTVAGALARATGPYPGLAPETLM